MLRDILNILLLVLIEFHIEFHLRIIFNINYNHLRIASFLQVFVYDHSNVNLKFKFAYDDWLDMKKGYSNEAIIPEYSLTRPEIKS